MICVGGILAVKPVATIAPVPPAAAITIMAGCSPVSLAFLAGFRAIVPMAHHADFRFVLPLLVPGCLFYALSVNRFRGKTRALQVLGYALGIAFVVLTMALFAPRRVPDPRRVQLDSPPVFAP